MAKKNVLVAAVVYVKVSRCKGLGDRVSTYGFRATYRRSITTRAMNNHTHLRKLRLRNLKQTLYDLRQ